jgi:hypothetical protein
MEGTARRPPAYDPLQMEIFAEIAMGIFLGALRALAEVFDLKTIAKIIEVIGDCF